MLKFLKIFVPAGTGVASVLALAYVAADQFVIDLPAPVREMIAVQPAMAQEAPAAEAAQVEVVVASAGAAAASLAGGYGIGREAMAEEVAAWDTDIRPDGLGLPVGSGDVLTGEELFIEKCSMCHGEFGEAVGRWPVLSNGYGTLTHKDPVKTIGSYWPYLSTVYDYVQRAMPFGEAASLSNDETYAIVAYLMYVNDLVDDEFVLSNENFTEVRLVNEDNFFMDDRMETEIPLFTQEACMVDCKETVEITMHASMLDVTPDSGVVRAQPAAEGTAETAPEAAPEAAPVAEEAAAPAEAGGVDMALIEDGEGVFKKCRACHQVGEGAVNRSGPQLNGLIGRTIGSVEGFGYSNVFNDANAAGQVWTEESLSAFLENPKGVMSGTKMSFAGLRSADDRAALLAYLQHASN
ncbi:MAG TPA: c-type cytochrome [Paracoccaceae bacterium]|nr:c-type cytochrome [Paracoccaceae bacterium]